MSETKLEVKSEPIAKIFAMIAKIHYDSENLALRKFRNVCKNFAMSNSEFFSFFFLYFLYFFDFFFQK